MRTLWPTVFFALALDVMDASAAVRYVNVNSAGPLPPYISWAAAATNIQQAIDAATEGDEILVTNGIYRTGGGMYAWSTVTNRVAVSKAVTVRSVNGPLVTIIEGSQLDNGPVRCAYVTNGAVLAGFTLTNGLARSLQSEYGHTDTSGGGVFCESATAIVSNCVIVGCAAQWDGGGAYSGTLNDCLFNANSAAGGGGGAQYSTLNNCTVAGNFAARAGGIEWGVARNCIVYHNRATVRDDNYSDSTLDYCCTTPLPGSGVSNITSEPEFADISHISATSPCRGAGNFAFVFGLDIDGEPWFNPPSMGCDEYHSGSITGPLSVAIQAAYTNVAIGFGLSFTGWVTGHAGANVWNFGDGTVLSNRLFVFHSWAGAGNFPVVFRAFNDSNLGGVSATVTVHVVSQPVHYVARSNATPASPYNSWPTAATNIQDAVNAANTVGALVLVTNGLYDAGGGQVAGASNRVAMTKPLVLQSVNGRDATVIDGNGSATCLNLASGASVSGFTITNGRAYWAGGGIYCESRSVVVSNCLIIGNGVDYRGGGAFLGTYRSCTFNANNASSGAGAYGATLENCVLNANGAGSSGGGADSSSLSACVVSSNGGFFGAGLSGCTATNCSITYNGGVGGGGANGSTLVNCLVISNTAAWYSGGGVRESVVHHCTLIGNSADFGGGADNSTLTSCTLSGNWVGDSGGGANNSLLTNCTLSGNWAYNNGGGLASSVAHNSAVSANSATNQGGGAFGSQLLNCTVAGNVAATGGGTSATTNLNSIVYYNRAQTVNPNYSGGRLSFCCTLPLPFEGTGNITSAPQITDLAHISTSSPCRAAGNSAFTTGVDRDGEAWLNPPAMGCDEFYTGAITGALVVAVSAAYTNVAAGFSVAFASQITGHAGASRWNFADGTVISNQPSAAHSWTSAGDYLVTFTAYNDGFPAGISATVAVHVVAQPVHYVARGNPAPVAPYNSWATAATNVQDAVDAASMVGALVLVTNGVYDAGGRDVAGYSNRVVVTLPVTLLSASGPAATLIDGGGVSRCLYLSSGTVMRGFTVTNGFVGASGAGVWSESADVGISNCVLARNISYGHGAGAYRGTFDHCTFYTNYADTWFGPAGGAVDSAQLNNCVLSGNSAAYGGGAYRSVLSNCSLTGNSSPYGGGGALDSTLIGCTITGNSSGSGGGAQSSVLDRCLLAGNSSGAGGAAQASTLYSCTLMANWSADVGGAANSSTLYNCALNHNTATNSGGGANASTLNNCTVVDNSSLTGGGGASASLLNNCIVFYNIAPNTGNFLNCTQSFCCTTPLPIGAGNFTTEPQLVDSAHIATGSPCRGAGNPGTVGRDIDGDAWANPPSMGCDEYISGSITGALSVAIRTDYANLATGYALSLTAEISGHASATVWDFGDGTTASNLLHASHAWVAGGDFAIVLRAYNESLASGASATVNVHVVSQPVHHVSLASTNPVPPYFTWGTAATNLQQAADVAYAGSTVLATNGVYEVGGRVVYGAMTNRLVVNAPVTVRSVNGPGVTSIRGNPFIGTNAVRCVYLIGGATLSGFTVTNGATLAEGDIQREQNGGAIWCESVNAVITNCVIAGNVANYEGGGVYGGALIACTLRTNFGGYNGGAAAYSAINSCVFSSNYAVNAGAGTVGCWATNCVFSNNVAGYGGATYNSTVVASHLSGNSAIDGGAAYTTTFHNCYLSGNTASSTAGAAIYSTLYNSALVGNSASAAGAVYDCAMTNCTVTGNRAVNTGGGAQNCRLANSIIHFNSAPDGSNHRDSTLEFCSTTPLPGSGTGNFDNEPLLADFSHLSSASPCRGAGNAAYVTGKDVDGESWASPPTVGCDEFYTGAITGALSVAASASFTNVATGFVVYFQSQITGHASANRWDLGDGTVLSNRLYVTHSWPVAGDYTVQFRVFNESNPLGVSTSLVVHVENPLHYVAVNNPTPAPPFTSWATAANHIQDAVNVAFAGAIVVVSNGVYENRITDVAGVNNRLAVTKPLTVRSVNGPGVTSITGAAGLRCAYLTNGVTLAGFTLTGASGVANGAGAFCQSATAIISNCVFTANAATSQGGGVHGGTIYNGNFNGNSAQDFGGGAYLSTLHNCTLTGNSTPGDASFVHHGGGAYACTLNFCTLTGNSANSGGGAYACTLNNCVISTNSAGYGGGANQSGLNNCLLVGNSANPSGGAANGSTLNNCTVFANSASYKGGGVFQCGLNNSILYLNNAPDGADAIHSSLTSCWNASPDFVNAAAGNFRLQTNSPCINAGNNSYVVGSADLDGHQRIVSGAVDIGAYEFLPSDAALFNQWLAQYGLPTDGSADFADSDGDGHNNWQEWRADTVPTNSVSVLRLATVTNSAFGLQVVWQSSAMRTYFLQRGTNLGGVPALSTIATNIPGQVGTTTYTDDTAVSSGPFFYRVGVQP